MKFFLLLSLFLGLYAQEDYSLRVAYGKVTESDFGEILIGDIKKHPEDLRVVSFDAGYRLVENVFDLPMDFYIKGGYARFDENGVHDDIDEFLLYIKLYYNFDFLDNRVRLGLGEGGSYVSRTLYTEYLEAIEKDSDTSKYLNYLDFSLDFDLGRLVAYEPLHDTYVGFVIKHRSSVFGLINNIAKGGSNYNCFYIEKNF